MRVPFVGPSYTARSTNLNAQRTLNWYVEQSPDGKSPVALLPRPGFSVFCDIGANPIRGGLVYGSTLYVVMGGQFYEVSEAGVATLKGSLNTTSGRVGMVAGGAEIFIGDGSYGYSYGVSTGTLMQVMDADFLGTLYPDFVDGMFITHDPGTATMRRSSTYDSQTWGSSDYARAESTPGDIVRVIVDHDELVVFKTDGTEFRYNDGGSNFPFSKVQGASLSRGCAAAGSVERVDNSVFWLGDDFVVYRLNGRSPVRISTHAVEGAIEGYSVVSDAYAFSYIWDGHPFYVLTFPTGNATWVYDVATNLWHEAGTFGLGRWSPIQAWRFANEVIVGDSTDGVLYTLSASVYTDAGTTIERVRTAQCIHEDQKILYHSRLEIDFEGGVGLLSGQGSAPVVMLSWSDDGGHNFGNEIYATLGETGQYGSRAVFECLGDARSRIYRARITDPVKAVLIGARGDGVSGAF